MSQAELPTTQAPDEPKPMPRISVAAAYARLAATCRAVNDIRYYLSGVYVEPRAEGGAYIVATNGHMMLAIIDKHAECSAATIIHPTGQLLMACPKANRHENKALLRTIEIDGQTALGVTDEFGLLSFVQVRDTTIENAKFPDWRRVLPNFEAMEPGCPQSVHPDYRNAPFAALDRKGSAGPSVECFHDRARGMLVQRLNHMDHVVHVVMPRRDDYDKGTMVEAWKGVRR